MQHGTTFSERTKPDSEVREGEVSAGHVKCVLIGGLLNVSVYLYSEGLQGLRAI